MSGFSLRRSVAESAAPLLRAALGDQAPVRLRGWDGSVTGPPDAPVQLTLASPRALRHLLWSPNELGFARAYVSGDVEVEGDLMAALTALDEMADPTRGPGVTIDRNTARELARTALRLGVIGRRPAPPPEEAELRGSRHSRGRDAEAISHHYDVGNDFYRIVLGETMTYSCAYWPEPECTLDEAQIAKCDLVARKLGLREGMRVLDVGCGWGTFAVHAAGEYGATVVGVTLSQEQADFARDRVKAAGLSHLVEIRVQDYRDVDDGPYDAISSIGMAEHVGEDLLPVYAADLYALLAPEGRLLNHAISRRPGPRAPYSKTSFIDRYVFPDGELESMTTMIGALEDSGLEIRDVESLREHYALTLRAWVGNLEQRWDEAVGVAGAGRARIWRLYMAGSALAFEAGRIGVNQILAVKPSPRGTSGWPRTRRELLS